jgi:hypothetical protein
MPFKESNLIKIQKGLTRGTKVIAIDNVNGKRMTLTFEGMHDEECPYKYCILHPRKLGKPSENPCQGFMRWHDEENNENYVGCPFVAGRFTVTPNIVIKSLILKQGGKPPEEIKPENY